MTLMHRLSIKLVVVDMRKSSEADRVLIEKRRCLMDAELPLYSQLLQFNEAFFKVRGAGYPISDSPAGFHSSLLGLVAG